MTSGRPPQPVSYQSLNGDEDRNNHVDAHHHLLHAAASLAAADLLNGRHVSSSPDSIIHPDLPRVATAAAAARAGPTAALSTTPPSAASNSQFQFHSQTIAPSPPAPEHASYAPPTRHHFAHQAPRANALQIQTDFHPSTPPRSLGFTGDGPSLPHPSSASSLRPVSRTPSLKSTLATARGTASAASSTVPSPVIAAMGDVTPLPSPLLAGDSPGPWRRLRRSSSKDADATSMPPPGSTGESVIISSSGESIAAALAYQNKRKAFVSGTSSAVPEEGRACPARDADAQHPHARNRSISDYAPEPMLMPKRMATVTGAPAKADPSGSTSRKPHLRREPHLSESRGLSPAEKPPTPPPSEASLSVNDLSSATRSAAADKYDVEYFEARGRHDQKRRRWRALKMLGQGTFSRVMLATSQVSPSTALEDEDGGLQYHSDSEPHARYDRRTLVAVKVCEHGPRGGASEERIEMSLKRELEIMQSINHPCLVHLKAWSIEPSRAILVLSYCPGGDLFDVASSYRGFLAPSLLQRIFAELVGATAYLHERLIVHRDIKLENVLVNLPPGELTSPSTDWTAYPHPVVTLTDLGLSRRIASDERLETRCGSDDYAAPEVIMGQPYDGRATDAWSLGVLLYALLENRLPFDPPPGIGDQAMQLRLRSRTSHRIARVEWRWVEYGVRDGQDGEGDHEADMVKFDAKGLRGAMEVVEGLLKRSRSRWPLSKVMEAEWVSQGVRVDGGIKFRDEDEGEEVL